MKTKISFILSSLLVLSGCASLPPDTNERLGQFTAASSYNIRNLEYEKSEGTASHVEGKTCYKVNLYTLDYMEGPKDNLLQRAMDDAIRNGQNNGLEGDLLVNARIERKTEYKTTGDFFKVKERYECVFVEGDLVKIASRKLK